MGVEQIALYYIHRRDTHVSIEAVTETLAGFVKSGKICGFGYSEISPTSLRAVPMLCIRLRRFSQNIPYLPGPLNWAYSKPVRRWEQLLSPFRQLAAVC